MKVFTTGRVAQLCKVTARTVAKAWFDTGKLKGYRIPGSQDRRIPREYLLRFLRDGEGRIKPAVRKNAIATLEDMALAKVLVFTDDQALRDIVRNALPTDQGFKVEFCGNCAIDCIGAIAFGPDVILFDSIFNGGYIEEIAREVNLDPQPTFAAIVSAGCHVGETFREQFEMPINADVLARRLRELVRFHKDI
ncbi:MAG: hypothetical protein PHO20_03600 [Candidatus Peribacteraceae bacterium]|nr:hypothetical protein [Candidatus Peribacteraceae bacterium]MDD5739826.1 hypothetical protein [Candidatus Peribacteraceae bacterium]